MTVLTKATKLLLKTKFNMKKRQLLTHIQYHQTKLCMALDSLTKTKRMRQSSVIEALEKRDSDKFKTDEAKNTFEALIYEFRSWLQEDSNAVYVEESEREALIGKCNSGEDWIYEAGSDVS
jgi:tRNA U34 5-carboxymethylaminomethyl modifying GTPase MnmE/TrmE